MAFTYTAGTPIFYVRLLIPDTVSPGIFSDDEINGFLAINQLTWQSSMFSSYSAGSTQLPSTPSNFLRAAALALNSLAGNSSRLAGVAKLLDVQMSADKAAKALQDTAQRYLDMDDNSGAFAIAEQVTTVWAFRDRWLAMLQRQTGGGFFA
jgi:hypothetical protein